MVDEKINSIKSSRRNDIVSYIVKLMLELDIHIREIEEKMTSQGKKGRRSARPRFYDPVTGATWSGRGKKPRWMKDREPDDFLISKFTSNPVDDATTQ
uniref:H-NS histone family protein n=1 Tax=Burkholderia arboris TaxID=488730 RepID=UPI003BEEB627